MVWFAIVCRTAEILRAAVSYDDADFVTKPGG